MWGGGWGYVQDSDSVSVFSTVFCSELDLRSFITLCDFFLLIMAVPGAVGEARG